MISTSLVTLKHNQHVRLQCQAQNRDLVLDIPQFVLDKALSNPKSAEDFRHHLGHSGNIV
jgi:hypothetical protein